jgi:hypothetical protein
MIIQFDTDGLAARCRVPITASNGPPVVSPNEAAGEARAGNSARRMGGCDVSGGIESNETANVGLVAQYRACRIGVLDCSTVSPGKTARGQPGRIGDDPSRGGFLDDVV